MQKDSSIPSITTRIFFICLSSSPKLMCSQKKAYKFNEKIPFSISYFDNQIFMKRIKCFFTSAMVP